MSMVFLFANLYFFWFFLFGLGMWPRSISKEATAKPVFAAKADTRPFPEKYSMTCQGDLGLGTTNHEHKSITRIKSLALGDWAVI